MAKPNCPDLYTTKTSLALTIVFFVNSALLLFDHFLPSILLSSASLASAILCKIAFTHFAEASESFETIFWSSFNLMSAHLATSGHSVLWDIYRARLFIALGCTILALHCMFLWCRSSPSRPSHRQEQALPLHVELSFQFISNGIVMAGRSFIPGGSLVWVLLGSAVMLCVSLVCFYKYCKAASLCSPDHTQ